MPRRLILIPRARSRLVGATRIESGYSKDYTPEQMRAWADDLARLQRTPAADLERWRSMTPDDLTPEQRGTLAAQDAYFSEAPRGIKGSLREDGLVELDGGRHRAGYLLERDVDPIPVWVSCPDERRLDAYAAQCERELPRARADVVTREPMPPRERPADEPRERDEPDDAEQRGDRVRA